MSIQWTAENSMCETGNRTLILDKQMISYVLSYGASVLRLSVTWRSTSGYPVLQKKPFYLLLEEGTTLPLNDPSQILRGNGVWLDSDVFHSTAALLTDGGLITLVRKYSPIPIGIELGPWLTDF